MREAMLIWASPHFWLLQLPIRMRKFFRTSRKEDYAH